MLAKPITAILAVALLFSASGTIGTFYFTSSQGQISTEPAALSLSESEASPGSVVEVEGAILVLILKFRFTSCWLNRPT